MINVKKLQKLSKKSEQEQINTLVKLIDKELLQQALNGAIKENTFEVLIPNEEAATGLIRKKVCKQYEQKGGWLEVRSVLCTSTAHIFHFTME